MQPSQEARLHTAVRRNAYFWVVMVLTVVFSAGASIFVTVTLTQRSERKLCDVVIATDDNYHRTPPSSPAGKTQAANFVKLRQQLGCPPYKKG